MTECDLTVYMYPVRPRSQCEPCSQSKTLYTISHMSTRNILVKMVRYSIQYNIYESIVHIHHHEYTNAGHEVVANLHNIQENTGIQ
jgi:hypothetical protein